MDRLISHTRDIEAGLRQRTGGQTAAQAGQAAQPAPLQPRAPSMLTRLTTMTLQGLAQPRTRFVACGLMALSLNVGSVPVACALGGLYCAGTGVAMYQILSRSETDDDVMRATECILEATSSSICALLFIRLVNKSTETDMLPQLFS